MPKAIPKIKVGDKVKIDTSDMPRFIQNVSAAAMRNEGLNFYGTFTVTDITLDESPSYVEEYGPYLELDGVTMYIPAIDFTIVEEAK